MISGAAQIPDGVSGVEKIVALLNRLKTYYGRLPAIRAAALRITRPKVDHDQAGQVNALARFVRSAVIYVADPFNAEFIQTPDVLLLEINQHGKAYGDCDDHCLLFAALCESLGISVDISGVVSVGGRTFDHVICTAYLDGGTLDYDLCAKGSVQPAYPEKLFTT